MRAAWAAALLVAVTLLSAGAGAAGEPSAGHTQGYVASLEMDGDLASGRSAVVATAPRAVVGLALEAPGAVYAYNSPYTTARGEVGNLSLVPLERIRRALA